MAKPEAIRLLRLKVGQTDVTLLWKKDEDFLNIYNAASYKIKYCNVYNLIVFATSETISYLSTRWKEGNALIILSISASLHLY